MVGIGAIQWIVSIIFGVAIVLAYFALGTREDAFLDREDGAGGSSVKARSLFLRIFGGLIVILGDMLKVFPLERVKLQAKLLRAGNPGNLTPDQFHATRIIATVIGAAAGLFIDGELSVFPLFFVLLGFLGVFYPLMWLNGTVQKRIQRVFRDLPDMLDTLRLAVDAGLDLSSALKVVVEKGRKGPLLEELEKVEKDIALGRTRKEAFRSFADRIGMAEVSAFVLALVQADQLGASVSPVLRTQADVARTRRWQLAEVLVNKLPMKMLGPLVLFIFPASFIILFTPLIIQWMQSE